MSDAEEHYIEDLTEYLEDHFKDRNVEVKANRAARWGEDFTINDIPEAYRTTSQLMNLPRNQDTLMRMTALVTDDEPVISQPPAEQTDAANRRASKVERWLSGGMQRVARERGKDSWRRASDGALADGMGVLKSVYLPDAWDDEPEPEFEDVEYTGDDGQVKKGKLIKGREQHEKDKADYRKAAPWPISLEDIDVLFYYPYHSGRRIEEVLEIAERPLVPTLKALNLRAEDARGADGKRAYKKLRKGQKFPVNGGLNSRGGTVKVTERWTPQIVQYYLEGKLVDERRHRYGRVPYFPIAGYSTSSMDPAKEHRSAIASMRPLVKSLNKFLTIWSNWLYLVGWPFMVEDGDTRLPNGMLPADTKFQDIPSGAILRGVKYMEPPNVNQGIQQMMEILQSEADRVGLTAVMYGANSGASSGYQVASLQAAAQSILKPVIRNIGLGLSDLCSFWLMLVDKRIEDTVPVWGRGEKKGSNEWLELGPKDIKGYYVVNVELKPLLPFDEIAQRDSAIRMYNAGAWPMRYVLEKTGEEQPEELMDERAAEDFVNSPAIKEPASRKLAEKMGLVEPPPPVPEPPPMNTLVDQFGNPMQPGPPGLPPMGPGAPSVPGAPGSMPLIPPQAQMGLAGIGGPNMPLVQRGPGGATGGPMPIP